MVTHRLFKAITNMSDDERRALLRLLEKGLLKGRFRREYYRKGLCLPVAYAKERHVYHNFTKDISLGGVFILTSIPFKVGDEIRVLFKTDEKSDQVGILGRVARVVPEGIGVRFISMNKERKAAILSLASQIP
jgi:Tfp pilus assembly protein PilZ